MPLSLESLNQQLRQQKHDGIDGVKLNTAIRDFDVSFESGEQDSRKLYFDDYSAQLVKARATATKAIAGTDSATITFKNSAGTTIGTITFAASDTINTEKTLTFSTNHKIAKESYVQVVSAKTTAGGKAHVELNVQRL